MLQPLIAVYSIIVIPTFGENVIIIIIIIIIMIIIIIIINI